MEATAMAGRGTTAEQGAEARLGYQVKLPLFEGPLDLLLFLIQKNQIDIYDIPIAKITEEYLGYLKLMRILQLDVASEFVVMAATLMAVKSQMLLPQAASAEDFELEDPREELVNRLLEYRLYKAAANTLSQREDQTSLIFSRPGEPIWADEEEQEDLVDVSLFDLLSAFQEIVDQEAAFEPHEVILEEVTVRERFDYILNVLTKRKRVSFKELIQSDPRTVVMVVNFLALLELMRAQLVSVKQEKSFGKIWIYGRIAKTEVSHPFGNTS
jgi:segregation and condensation protein A